MRDGDDNEWRGRREEEEEEGSGSLSVAFVRNVARKSSGMSRMLAFSSGEKSTPRANENGAAARQGVSLYTVWHAKLVLLLNH